jgi:hypothetical protein
VPASSCGPAGYRPSLTCAVPPTAGRSPSSPTPWRPDRCSTGIVAQRFPTRRTAPCITSPMHRPVRTLCLWSSSMLQPPKTRRPKHPLGWTLALRLRTSTTCNCARGWPYGLTGSFLAVQLTSPGGLRLRCAAQSTGKPLRTNHTNPLTTSAMHSPNNPTTMNPSFTYHFPG